MAAERVMGSAYRGPHHWRSRIHAALLLAAMAALLGYCGWVVAGSVGILWSLLGGLVLSLGMPLMPPNLLLRAIGARPIDWLAAPALHDSLAALCRAAGLARMPLLCWFREPLPVAFTVGRDETAAIVLSDGLLQILDLRELRGILAHEVAHMRNHDMALMQLAMTVGRLTQILAQIAFFFLLFELLLRTFDVARFPIVPLFVIGFAPIGVSLLQLALARAREAEADLAAAELTGEPRLLAAALSKIREREAALLRTAFPGMAVLRVPLLLRDHPATEERIRRLLELPEARHRRSAEPGLLLR